jgi:hypothetical protein
VVQRTDATWPDAPLTVGCLARACCSPSAGAARNLQDLTAYPPASSPVIVAVSVSSVSAIVSEPCGLYGTTRVRPASLACRTVSFA